MSVFHILNGDCLQNQLRSTSLVGEQIVVRECLLVGDVVANSFEEFIEKRADFISKEYSVTIDDYERLSKFTFKRILEIPEKSDVYLWFENDLFCQVNMWYVLSLLEGQRNVNIYRVFPPKESNWDGFAYLNDVELRQCYEKAIRLDDSDRKLAYNLWKAFAQGDAVDLAKYAFEKSNAFELLPRVCDAAIDDMQNGTALKLLTNIIKDQKLSFEEIFAQFSAKMGIYGYGDLQVKSFLKKIEGQK